jgi:4-amino-4-deoxy-L-arabinose transferase-like glycosyltransferase
MGAQHEGYLFYYFWEEHFGRFTTAEFNRAEPWYYFILVAIGGFLPWSLLLPFVVAKYRKKDFDEKTLFILLWVGLPVLFYSLSRSKLAHYILPIFPPLAVFAATLLVRYYQESARSARFVLSLTWGAVGLLALYFIVGALWPVILPYPIRGAVGSFAKMPWLYAAATLFLLFFLVSWQRSRAKPGPSWCYLAQFSTMVLFLIFIAQLMIATSSVRSAKGLAEKAVSMITPTTQLVFYDTYLAGMPYYLRSEKPIWMVTHSRKRKTFLGNYYALANREEPVTRWGEALLDYDQFSQRWRSAKQPMVIFLKEKNQTRLEQEVGAAVKRVGAFDEYIVLHKP